jgi:hypothetical protein
MSKNLRKFVNPRFLRTVDLSLFRRLLEPHAAQMKGIELGTFESDPDGARQSLQVFFAGPEESYPEGLVIDLHRIAELGDRNGLRILLEEAARKGVQLCAGDSDESSHEPKHVAIRAFLDQREMFDSAADMLSCIALSSFSEYVGMDEGVEPRTDDASMAAFRQQAEKLFEADLRTRFCRVAPYDDDGEISVVVTHGAPLKTTEVIEDGTDRFMRFREIEHAVLSYESMSGRLKVGRLPKARRAEFAEIFAATMLGRPGFFGADDAQNLYTLEPIERSGFRFAFNHAFDPGIRGVRIVQAQADQIGTDPRSGKTRTFQSFISRGHGGCALRGLGERMQGITFGAEWRLNHVVLRVDFDIGEARPTRVTIKLKPPGVASFKRHRFEGRILELLRRNGLMVDRDPGHTALAAE